MANLQKYASTNSVQRWLIARFLGRVVELARRAPAGPILDAGCGEGFVAAALLGARGEAGPVAAPGRAGPVGARGEARPLAALDASRPALGHLRRAGIAALPILGDLGALPFADRSFSLVVATEVLEHLADPGAALAELCRVAAGPVLLSVPWEPFFAGLNLLRGRNLRRLGSDADHRQHWTRAGFLRFAARRLRVLSAPGNTFPWTLVLGEVLR